MISQGSSRSVSVLNSSLNGEKCSEAPESRYQWFTSAFFDFDLETRMSAFLIVADIANFASFFFDPFFFSGFFSGCLVQQSASTWPFLLQWLHLRVIFLADFPCFRWLELEFDDDAFVSNAVLDLPMPLKPPR